MLKQIKNTIFLNGEESKKMRKMGSAMKFEYMYISMYMYVHVGTLRRHVGRLLRRKAVTFPQSVNNFLYKLETSTMQQNARE